MHAGSRASDLSISTISESEAPRVLVNRRQRGRGRTLSPEKRRARVVDKLRSQREQRAGTVEYWLPRQSCESSPSLSRLSQSSLARTTAESRASRSRNTSGSLSAASPSPSRRARTGPPQPDAVEAQTPWESSYCIIDLEGAAGAEGDVPGVLPMRAVLAGVHSSVPKLWLSGLRPCLHSSPLFKISSPEHERILNNLIRDTPPFVLELVQFRISRVQRFEEEVMMDVVGIGTPTQRTVLALEVCMRSPKLQLLKDAWLRTLGDSVDAFRAQLLYAGDHGGCAGRKTSTSGKAGGGSTPHFDVYLTLARVGAEWIDEITAVCAEANARFAVAAADGKVRTACHISELSKLRVSGKIGPSTLDISEGATSKLPLTGVPAVEAEIARPYGYISLLIADELRESEMRNMSLQESFSQHELSFS